MINAENEELRKKRKDSLERMRQRFRETQEIEMGLFHYLSPIYYIFINSRGQYKINENNWQTIINLLHQRQESVPASFVKLLNTTLIVSSNKTIVKGLKEVNISQADTAEMAQVCYKLLERTERELNWLSQISCCTPFLTSASLQRDILSLVKTDKMNLKWINIALIALPLTLCNEFVQWIFREVKMTWTDLFLRLNSRNHWRQSEQKKRQKHFADQEILGELLRQLVLFLQRTETDGVVMMVTVQTDTRARNR